MSTIRSMVVNGRYIKMVDLADRLSYKDDR